ncbi:MAG: DUF3500 domain-containing protein, partial [Gemmatimonadetes bacterium]|nr:DUF3500 domain-containing protein [Gemmatimonadota bacterium]
MTRTRLGRVSWFSALALTLVSWAASPLDVTAQRRSSQGQPFFGVTTDGDLIPDLFPIRATGVSTAPIVEAARAYLRMLRPEQIAETSFGLDSDEWRHWSNVPVGNLPRQGLSFRDMSDPQREAAFAMVRAGLSARGFEQARNIMRIDGYLAAVLENYQGYGEYLYFIDIFGEPSYTEPWGWQLDGHHLVVNYFVMGDQVVMSPNFWGSEPVSVDTGRYANIEVLQEEQDVGLAFMESLRRDQLQMAVVDAEKLRNYLMQSHADGTEYLLLAGDETLLPIRYAYHRSVSEMPPMELLQVCDLYFADLTGQWDLDNDGIWGESMHDRPD